MAQNPDDLTPSQRQAVERTEGPVLVLAGPGSGKTRVITRRITRIVESGIDPGRVLAITFTNKAAGEMSDRVARLLPGSRVWISTFHRFCARILRRRAEAVGLRSNFTILDVDDQRRLVRDVIRDLNLDPVHFPPPAVAERISRAKNDLQTAEIFRRQREERVGDFLDSVVVRAYPEYQRRLLESNAVDFDDLLLHVVEMLAENPEVRAELDDRFLYVLVDEYQDTNLAQYRIVAALSQDHRNLCVTGDPDQSIYGWRGARIENILRFEADYPDAAVIRLEENFRSTQSILAAADRLIAYNMRRKAKTMRTVNPTGLPVDVLRFADARAEAEGIARSIQKAVQAEGRRWSDFAVFYRVNALSRELEHALAQRIVPYQVAAGFAFYERAEIKDLIAYLRLIVNPRDRAAFLRVVNVPARKIGKKSLARLMLWADESRLSLLEAAAAAEKCPGLPHRAATSLADFASLIADLAARSGEPVKQILEQLLERTRYADGWRGSTSEQDQQRLANVDELVSVAAQFDASIADGSGLEGFLEGASLVSDVDSVDGGVDRVTLMTLHAAKGLEFPVVYIVGLEQGLLPHERASRSDDPAEHEEERRLLFVGMTRAREQLALTRTENRAFRGISMTSIPSDFLREVGIPETIRGGHAVAWTAPVDADAGDAEHGWRDEHPDEPDGDAAPDASARGEQSARARPRRARLMTGADLLAGAASREPELPIGYAVGTFVRHPRYGLGRIVKVSGFAKNRTLTVEFESDGRNETFVAGKNPLQPVGAG